MPETIDVESEDLVEKIAAFRSKYSALLEGNMKKILKMVVYTVPVSKKYLPNSRQSGSCFGGLHFNLLRSLFPSLRGSARLDDETLGKIPTRLLGKNVDVTLTNMRFWSNDVAAQADKEFLPAP